MTRIRLSRYVVRWNATIGRKEHRAHGRNSWVVGGGEITVPTAPDLTITASPNPADIGATVTVTASATGGAAPYVYTLTKPAVIPSWTGTGATRTFTVPTTTSDIVINGSVTDGASQTQQASVTLAVNDAAPVGSLFAGHKPGRVLLGMATASGNPYRPGLTEAIDLLGHEIYEGREFDNGVFTTASANSMAAPFDAVGAYPVLSWKPGNWSNVYTAGGGDAKLLQIYDWAVTRRTAGAGGRPRPAAVSYHHEPNGDPQGTLTEWANMHDYCSNFLAGRRGGTKTSTYVAAHDVSDIVAWCTIGNGFWWLNPGTAGQAGSLASQAYPQKLIDSLRLNRHILMNDFYDADYQNQTGALSNEALRVPKSNGVPTSSRIQNFMTWARAKNTGAVGCGEFGVILGSEMTNCWNVMKDNVDLWAVSNYFNSAANSDHEWRTIPSNYPAYNPINGNDLVDFGGNAQSQGRLNAFVDALEDSKTAVGGGTPFNQWREGSWWMKPLPDPMPANKIHASNSAYLTAIDAGSPTFAPFRIGGAVGTVGNTVPPVSWPTSSDHLYTGSGLINNTDQMQTAGYASAANVGGPGPTMFPDGLRIGPTVRDAYLPNSTTAGPDRDILVMNKVEGYAAILGAAFYWPPGFAIPGVGTSPSPHGAWSCRGGQICYFSSYGFNANGASQSNWPANLQAYADDSRNGGNRRGSNPGTSVIRWDEFTDGPLINHVIEMYVGAGVAGTGPLGRFPQTVSTVEPGAVIEDGTRFHIKWNVNLASKLNWLIAASGQGAYNQALMIATALQKYGFYIGQTSGGLNNLRVEGNLNESDKPGRMWTLTDDSFKNFSWATDFEVIAPNYDPPSSTTPVPTGLPAGLTWTSVFFDEFTGTTLDLTRWSNMEGASMNNVTCRAANISVSGSVLTMTLPTDVSGAFISSSPADGAGANGYLFQVGDYAEASVRFPGNGTMLYNWPAFWTSGPNWPAAGEHDVAEVLGGDLTINYHSPTSNLGPFIPTGYRGDAFHTYGIHRKATSVDIYWDGVKVKTYNTADNGAGQSLLLNLGTHSSGADVTGAASQVKCDWIRAWRSS